MMTALVVMVHETEVGTLEVFDDYSHRFTFSRSYTDLSDSFRPVLGQLFEDRIPSPIDVAGPMAWFSHLLPQGAMRAWRCRILRLEESDDFELLAYLGQDMPGAVTLLPGESPVRRSKPSVETRPTPDSEVRFKFSLAGAQWKLSARSNGRGLTTAATGDGTACIAKFDAPEYPDLPRCEFATMTWARNSGLDVPPFKLCSVGDFDEIPEGMPTGSGDVFVIDRFGRNRQHGRIHMEDFCQILDRPPGQQQYSGSYEDIASVVSWICPADAEQYLRLIVFCIICGNGDAHLKNFSAVYPDRLNARISPVYDVVSTVCYYRPDRERLALFLNNEKRFAEFRTSSFKPLCRLLRLNWDRALSVIRETVNSAMEAWNTPEIACNFSDRHVKRINQHLQSLSLIAD